MTTFNKATSAETTRSAGPPKKAFYFTVGFSLPTRSGRLLALTLSATFTLGGRPAG